MPKPLSPTSSASFTLPTRSEITTLTKVVGCSGCIALSRPGDVVCVCVCACIAVLGTLAWINKHVPLRKPKHSKAGELCHAWAVEKIVQIRTTWCRSLMAAAIAKCAAAAPSLCCTPGLPPNTLLTCSAGGKP